MNLESDSSSLDDDNKPGRGVYLLPNLLTTGTLFSGFYAIVAAIDGNFSRAGMAVFIAMLFDGLDGRVARWTNTQRTLPFFLFLVILVSSKVSTRRSTFCQFSLSLPEVRAGKHESSSSLFFSYFSLLSPFRTLFVYLSV